MEEFRRRTEKVSPGEPPEQRDKARKDLWLMLAHDLRNPLLGVQRVLELVIQEPHGITAQTLQLLNDAQTNCELMVDMLGDILDVCRLENKRAFSPTTRVDLMAVIEKSVRMLKSLADEKIVSFKIIAPTNTPKLRLDEHRLIRIFINLFHNALKFSPVGGKVEVAVQMKGDELLIISVTDRGKGIPLDQSRRIFNKYYQHTISRRNVDAGLGWGLYYCNVAVTALGGKIWVESPPEGLETGSRFCLTLPVFH